MDIAQAQAACVAAGLPIDVADRVLLSAEEMRRKGLPFTADEALRRSAEGHAKRMRQDGGVYVYRQRETKQVTLWTSQLRPGDTSARILPDMPFSDYASLRGWNWSRLKALRTGSPRHVWHALTAPDEETTSRGKLRAIHAAVLEPHVFARDFVVYDGPQSIPLDRVTVYTDTASRSTKAFKAFEADHPDEIIVLPSELETTSTSRSTTAFKVFARIYAGVTILTRSECDDVWATAEAIHAHPFVRDLLSSGRAEVTVQWVDPMTGVPCKARLDWFHEAECIVDLKTGGTTHEDLFARLVARNGWHGQLAHYDAGATAATGVKVRHAYLIAAEGKGCNDVAVFRLDRGEPDGALAVGHALRRELLDRLAVAIKSDEWPGRHPSKPFDLVLPSYALLDYDDEITMGDDA